MLIVSGDRWGADEGAGFSSFAHWYTFHTAYKEFLVGFKECVVELKSQSSEVNPIK